MKASALILDPSAQPRVQLDQETIERYRDAYVAGKTLPPVVAFGDEDRAYLADGWHRFHAAQQAGLDDVPAELRPGGLDEARWFAYSTNAEHGLPRSREDTRRAVEGALTQRTTLSDRMIAEHCGVSHPYVATVRRELEQRGVVERTPVRETRMNGVMRRIVPPPAIGPRPVVRSSVQARAPGVVDPAVAPSDITERAAASLEQVDEARAVAILNTMIRKIDALDVRRMADRLMMLGHGSSSVDPVVSWFERLRQSMRLAETGDNG